MPDATTAEARARRGDDAQVAAAPAAQPSVEAATELTAADDRVLDDEVAAIFAAIDDDLKAPAAEAQAPTREAREPRVARAEPRPRARAKARRSATVERKTRTTQTVVAEMSTDDDPATVERQVSVVTTEDLGREAYVAARQELLEAMTRRSLLPDDCPYLSRAHGDMVKAAHQRDYEAALAAAERAQKIAGRIAIDEAFVDRKLARYTRLIDGRPKQERVVRQSVELSRRASELDKANRILTGALKRL